MESEQSDAVSSRWFGGSEGRNPEEVAFLNELRRLAALWDVPDLNPDDHTSAEVILAPLLLGLDVPGVTARRDNLQLAYWTGPESWLTGEWGTEYILDDHDGNSPECLTVRGVRASPEEFASFAAGWMLRQLQRPLVREDWLSGDVPHATRWRFTDTGHVLDRDGLSLRRLLRRQPDRVVAVRGGDLS